MVGFWTLFFLVGWSLGFGVDCASPVADSAVFPLPSARKGPKRFKIAFAGDQGLGGTSV